MRRYAGRAVGGRVVLVDARCSSSSVGAGGAGAAANGSSTSSATRVSRWNAIDLLQQRLRRGDAGLHRLQQLPLAEVGAHQLEEARLGQVVVAQHAARSVARSKLPLGAAEGRHVEHRLRAAPRRARRCRAAAPRRRSRPGSPAARASGSATARRMAGVGSALPPSMRRRPGPAAAERLLELRHLDLARRRRWRARCRGRRCGPRRPTPQSAKATTSTTKNSAGGPGVEEAAEDGEHRAAIPEVQKRRTIGRGRPICQRRRPAVIMGRGETRGDARCAS